MPEAPTPASPLEALKAGFRRACVRRLVGDEGGAIEVLRDDIPSLVVNWAKSTSLEPSEKKAKLKEMFDDESGRLSPPALAATARTPIKRNTPQSKAPTCLPSGRSCPLCFP